MTVGEATKAKCHSEGWHSFAAQYRMTVEVLGRGTFGKVCKAVSRHNDQDVAVKVIRLGTAEGQLNHKTLSESRDEERIMQRIGRHDHVVALLDSFCDLMSQRFYFVMERCRESLMDSSEYVLSCEDATFSALVGDMVKAIFHIHKRGVIHRDIKPDNLLFADERRSTLKLCDFGLAVASKSKTLSGRFGTMPFMSPEMAAASGHSFSTDIWSLGATLYLLIFGDLPYRPPKMCREQLKRAIIIGHPFGPTFEPAAEAIAKRPSKLTDEVKQMLVRDRHHRPSANRLLRVLGGGGTRSSLWSMPGKLKAALHLKVHFGCWKAQHSDDDDMLGKPHGLLRAVTN